MSEEIQQAVQIIRVAYDGIEMYPDNSVDEIVTELLLKYKDRADVTEEELRICHEDVNHLVNIKKLWGINR